MKLSHLVRNSYISIALMALSSIMLLLIPLGNFDGKLYQKIMAYMVALLFWTGIISGWAIQFVMSKKVKKHEKGSKNCFGAIRFFKNKPAKITDCIMIILFLIIIVLSFILQSHSNIQFLFYIIISIFIFAFQMHCYFNGRNFRYIYFFTRQQKERTK